MSVANQPAVDPFDVRTWPEELRYCYEERAGIMQYDGGMSREDAEKFAREDTWWQR